MFARLKKKIEEETHSELAKGFATSNSSVSSPSPSATRKFGFGQQSPPRETNSRPHNSSLGATAKQRKGSEASVDSDSGTDKSIQDDLLTNKDLVRKLDAKVQEYSKAIKEHQRTKEKLEDALERQQDLMFKSLEKRDEEWKHKLEAKERERLELIEKLTSAEMMKDKIIKKQEVIDELEGFQTQEMAKVKHMLLNCQQEFQQNQTKLKETVLDLNDSKETVDCLRTELDRLQKQIKKEETDRLQRIAEESSAASLIKELEEKNQRLEPQLNAVVNELQEVTAKLSQMERNLSDLQDENDALHHTHDTYTAQASKTLAEKNSLISHLEERIATLEQRVANTSLTGDEKLEALITERNGLEQKLEESRHHVNEIKSTWSEKIMSLEKQISNLNKKMAEDSQEMRRIENCAETMQNQLQEKIVQLEEELQETHSQNRQINDMLIAKDALLDARKCAYEEDLVSHQATLEKIKQELQSKIDALDKQMASLKNAHHLEESNLQQKISLLDGQLTDCLEKEIESERQLSNLQEEKSQLKKDLQEREREFKTVTQQLEKSSLTMVELGQTVANVEKDKRDREATNESLRKSLADLENKHQAVQSEFSSQQKINTELQADLENLTDQLKNEGELCRTSISKLEAALSESQAEVTKQQKLVKDAEDAASQSVENASRANELKALVNKLEHELADKNKTVRLQQQRINDMKKTLQRELKMQSYPFEASNGEQSEKESVLNSVSLSQSESHHSELLQKLSSYDMKGPLGEDVNFCYLKHVVLKFMTSREYEAQHLIKAVSVLLHFTPDEERLIRDTLEWKMSWFGAKPKFGKGQMAKTIPTT